MPEMDARIRAEYFLRDFVDSHDDDSETFYAGVSKLTEAIEEAEGYAESKGREEMIDSAEENTLLKLHIKHLLPVAESVKAWIEAKKEVRRVFAVDTSLIATRTRTELAGGSTGPQPSPR